MLFLSCPRPINFIIAASSVSRLAPFLKFVNFIPTVRPIDKKILGDGKCKFKDLMTLQGENTKFTKQITKTCTIVNLETKE